MQRHIHTEISLFNFSNLQVNVFFFLFHLFYIIVFSSQHFILVSLEMDALGNLLSKHNNTIYNIQSGDFFFVSIINAISIAYMMTRALSIGV